MAKAKVFYRYGQDGLDFVNNQITEVKLYAEIDANGHQRIKANRPRKINISSSLHPFLDYLIGYSTSSAMVNNQNLGRQSRGRAQVEFTFINGNGPGKPEE